MQLPMYRILPAGLQNGREISVVAVLFTQGVNEQQSIADTYVRPCPLVNDIHDPYYEQVRRQSLTRSDKFQEFSKVVSIL